MPSYMKWSSTINSSKQCRHCKRRGRDKHRQIELERKKSALSKLLKVSQTYQNETLPFVGEVAGYSISRLVRCPFKRSIKTFEPWLKSRIKKCCEHGSLRPRDLQSIFGLHHYCNLNNLSQEQLKMIMLLSYLFKLAFYKGDKFQEYISQCQVQWIICSTFIQTTIYHGGRTNYSENCHRALCAIYFDLLGEGTTGFSFDECLDPARCPLDSAREDYVPSTELRLRRDEMEDGSSTGAEHQVNNLRRNANDNALGFRVWVASRNVAECLE